MSKIWQIAAIVLPVPLALGVIYERAGGRRDQAKLPRADPSATAKPKPNLPKKHRGKGKWIALGAVAARGRRGRGFGR